MICDGRRSSEPLAGVNRGARDPHNASEGLCNFLFTRPLIRAKKS